MSKIETEHVIIASHGDDAAFKTKEYGIAEVAEKVFGERLLIGWVKASRAEKNLANGLLKKDSMM